MYHILKNITIATKKFQEKTFKPKPGVTQYKNVIRFNQVGPGCYRPKDQLKEVPNGCKCPK